jgi:hypothetical protein
VLLTAQRVAGVHGRGINVYEYHHGVAWDGMVPSAFLPATDPGTLARYWEQVPSGGNDVVSYLDFVAPDGMNPIALHQALATLKYVLPPQTTLAMGSCWVHFGTCVPIAPQTEIGALAGSILLRLSGA